ncbi:hypothetical protein J1P26_18420 [Neobacillus sp. MM2021_6]|uniref:DUF2207 domain-containing protein n=1 Tax=Bacillaceae TaxID=186817 RepID=UPI00140B560C|nr:MULTISPECIES: DUF2207 domain-containing protein [Bacillaceae]MBO0961682.1 hypothetical protein [Neobacillus sp. MM2021_6]NHC18273.1 DUF2207 domain-containing protein [Bacillus sp. MM2020_4]WML40010.1 DUF2207 domain-containing protein [Neobacillus sp. OS1-2]
MKVNEKILNTVKIFGGLLLAIGIATFFYSFFGNGYSNLTGIAIGIIVGAVFIFLMGIFFVVTEEMLKTTEKRIQFESVKRK